MDIEKKTETDKGTSTVYPKHTLGFYKVLSHIVSLLFHPLLVPVQLFALMFKGIPGFLPVSDHIINQLLIAIFLFTFVFPVVGVMLMHWSGYVKSLTMPERSDRVVPLIFTSFVYIGTTYLFIQYLHINTTVIAVIEGITFTIILATLISFYWKISTHSIGICGAVGFLLALTQKIPTHELFYPLILTLLMAGAVGSARLYLNAHTPAQVAAGSLLGFSVGYFSIIWFA